MTDFLHKVMTPDLPKRVWKKFRSFFILDQWILLIANHTPDKKPSWDNFKRIIPPSDRIWADPFIWLREGNYYVFFEEKSLNSVRGHINCMRLNENLEIISIEPVLERSYHLSHPFLFEYQGNLYMLPETGENRTIEIYRCIQFPEKWEKVKNLMTGVYAVDATLLEAKERWWLFANIGKDGGSTWDTLYLFYANDPLSEFWIPHPCNPIVKDIRSSRPAGKIYSDQKGFVRPSQDCSVRYGYAINFNRITKLTESEYEEIQEWKFTPTPKDITATHTWNEAGGVYIIDAKVTSSKLLKNRRFSN